MKVLMLDTVLHPFDLNPEDPDDGQGFTLRYEQGKVYEVEEDDNGPGSIQLRGSARRISQATLFFLNGWAEEAEGNPRASTPFDTRNATDKEAERLEAEVHAPARALAAGGPALELEVQDSHTDQGAEL